MAEISSKSWTVFTLLFFSILFLSFVNGSSKFLKHNDDVLLNSRVKEAGIRNDQVPSEQPEKIVSIVDEVKEDEKRNDQALSSEQLDTIVSVVDKKRFNTRVNNGCETEQIPDYIQDLKDMIEEQTKIIQDLNKKVTHLTQHFERSGSFAGFLFFVIILYFVFAYLYSYS